MIGWLALAFACLALLLSGGLWAVIATMRWWLPRLAPALLAQRKPAPAIRFERERRL